MTTGVQVCASPHISTLPSPSMTFALVMTAGVQTKINYLPGAEDAGKPRPLSERLWRGLVEAGGARTRGPSAARTLAVSCALVSLQWVCVHYACVRVCVHACARACVCVCTCVCVWSTGGSGPKLKVGRIAKMVNADIMGVVIWLVCMCLLGGVLFVSWESGQAPWYLVEDDAGVGGLVRQSARYFLICYQVRHLHTSPSISRWLRLLSPSRLPRLLHQPFSHLLSPSRLPRLPQQFVPISLYVSMMMFQARDLPTSAHTSLLPCPAHTFSRLLSPSL